MEVPVKTLKSGLSLPVYGLGTWGMGGLMEADSSKDETDVAAIKAALDRGVTHIDTAESYGGGHTEELVGEAIKDYDRSQLFITSKVSAWNQNYDDLLRSCEGSLRRLGTDYLDLYLLHRFPEPGTDIDGTVRALDKLVSEGKVKHIGVSNMTIARFQEIQKRTSNKIVCNQLEYSLKFREAERRGIIEYCQHYDVMVVAWGPLRIGALDQRNILHELADKYGKTPHQVALNWLLSQPNIVTIPKSSSLKHLEENLGALGWELEPEDVERLTHEFPDQQDRSARVPLDYAADIEP